METAIALKSKEIITKATSSGGNVSITESSQLDSQNIIIGQLRSIIKQIENNQKAFKVRINNIGITKLKMPAVKRFNRIKIKLKGFLAQIRFKLYNKGHKVAIQADAVAYTGLFLSGKALEWFKPYIIEY